MLSFLSLLLTISAIGYTVTLLLFFVGLFLPNKKKQDIHYTVSVVIAARNEEFNLPNILSDLTKQTYNKQKYEVIVIDDHSSDNTYEIAKKFEDTHTNFKILKAKTDKSGILTAKKNAIHQGILASNGEIILTTDADCRVKHTWIETMITYFTKEVGMVVGFSQIGKKGQRRSLFEQLQAIDFLALLAGAQGALNLGLPLAATGQNLAYRKKTYLEVDGFNQIGHRISGDDVLLLQLIHKQTKWKIKFAPSQLTFNHTEAEKSFRGFFNQRRRWASNGSYQLKLNELFFVIVVNTFLINLLLIVGLTTLIFSPQFITTFLCAVSYKILAEFLIIVKGSSVYSRNDLIKYYPLWVFIQIPYVVITGSLGNLTRFVWKGRKL